ncbi:unnamed protein product [Phytomonas sp. Hart1]|nr:unnamed protein product [Phytomonas sp. Hart1]|eukprot:CCW68274.1 unnamed protein product [Phytomonas sp. isolate Hart1]
MGQPNAKESKHKGARSSTGMILHDPSSMMTGVGLIPSTVRDIVLQTGHGSGGNPVYSRHAETTSVGQGIQRGHGPIPTQHFSNSNVAFPVVLRYLDQDVKTLLARRVQVCVAVEAMDWKPLLMTPSTDSFYALLELPPGKYKYRFIIDGKEVVDSTQPLAPQEDTSSLPPTTDNEGKDPHENSTNEVNAVLNRVIERRPANLIVLDESSLNVEETDGYDPIDDEKGWGQEETISEESRKYPPLIPLHLRYTPLNSPPTLVRCARNGCLSVVDASSAGNSDCAQPEHLPLPLSVTINHVYFQRREDHAVMGVTTRHSDKFTTVVYYTPLPVQ